jgi:hypothetical protein
MGVIGLAAQLPGRLAPDAQAGVNQHPGEHQGQGCVGQLMGEHQAEGRGDDADQGDEQAAR